MLHGSSAATLWSRGGSQRRRSVAPFAARPASQKTGSSPKWRQQYLTNSGQVSGPAAKPFGGRKPSEFLQKLFALRETLQKLDSATELHQWHHDAALVLLSKGFEQIQHLDGLGRRDISRWSENPRVQALLFQALDSVTEAADNKRQNASASPICLVCGPGGKHGQHFV